MVCCQPSRKGRHSRSASSTSFPLHRRVRIRLGCFAGRRPSIRLAVSGCFEIFHQPPRTPCCYVSDPRFSPSPPGSVGLTFHQQHDRSGFSAQGGGTRSSSLNAVAQAILHVCEANAVRLLPQFVPGRLSVLADSLSRGSQVLGSEWTLCQEVCREFFCRWLVNIDLFATSLNRNLQVYFSSMVDQQSAGTNAMLQTWDNLHAYAFPPFGFIQRVLTKVRQSRNLEMTLVAPVWPLKLWSPDLSELPVDVPVLLPMRKDLLKQPHFHHYKRNLPALRLTGFRVASNPRDTSVFLREWRVNLPSANALQRV